MIGLQELKSIEIIPEKKIFKVNGEDFGRYCERYEIEIYQEKQEICVVLRRRGMTKFVSKFDAKSGENISRLQFEESGL